MRSLLLFLLALGVFFAAYVAVAWLMPDPQSSPRRQAQVVHTEPRDADHLIGDIDGVTLRSHDAATGAPIAEIRIGEYRRSGENQVVLREIEATILTEGGSGIITLSAPTGTVDLEAEAQQEDRLTPEALGTADIARLSDVVVRWYETPADAARGPGAALLTLRVNNLIYDNKQFSLFTDDTVIDGGTVLADDVPVEVRGRDYDFDGRGLLVRWDARTRRPTLFRVAQGERLTIKTDKAFVPDRIVWNAAEPPANSPLLASLDSRVTAEALVEMSQDPAAGAGEPYLATLDGNIRAVQGGLTMLEADAARLLFSIDSLPEEDQRVEPHTSPATEAQRAPSTGPTSSGVPFVPITVYWEGELRIEAASDPGEPALSSPKDMRLALFGSPLVMRQEEVEARGLELRYARVADLLELVGDESTPVTLVDAEQNTLVTTLLSARPNAGTATAKTPGYADVVTGPGEVMQLRWQQDCDFVFQKVTGSDTGREAANHLKSVAARGGVAVRHPDVWLDSATLDVALEAVAGSDDPQLRSVAATGGVQSRINPESEDERSLESEKLSLELPEGPEGPVLILAEGGVKSDQDKRALSSDVLHARLLPDEQGDLKLADLVANGQVRGTDEQGPQFRADVLIATPLPTAKGQKPGDDPPMLVRLEGAEGRNAVVEVGKDVLAAPALEFNTADQTVHVPGKGEVYSVQQEEEGVGWPLVVTWTSSMLGGQKQVTIAGEVRLEGRRAAPAPGLPATFIDVQADQAVIDLASTAVGGEGQAQQPATAPSAWTGDIEHVALRGALRATVEERQNESVLRSFDLRSDALEAWPVGEQARVVIDSAGRVLFRDLRPSPPRQPARPVSDMQQGPAPTAAGFRGNAAVEWSQRLSFDPDTGVLLLEGGVTVAVEPLAAPNAAAGRTFRLDADQVRAVMIQADQGAGGAARRQPEIRSIFASGAAQFSTEGVSFEAGEIQYDPTTSRVTAKGAEGAPVVVFDADGVPTGRFAELVYNVETGQVEQLRDLAAGG